MQLNSVDNVNRRSPPGGPDLRSMPTARGSVSPPRPDVVFFFQLRRSFIYAHFEQTIAASWLSLIGLDARRIKA
jgi:hypothetical protein